MFLADPDNRDLSHALFEYLSVILVRWKVFLSKSQNESSLFLLYGYNRRQLLCI